MMCAVLALVMAPFFSAHACSTGKCDENSDCNSMTASCTSGNASCKGEVDEDYTKGGTQGCNGHCECSSS